jgi:hypothetical protein
MFLLLFKQRAVGVRVRLERAYEILVISSGINTSSDHVPSGKFARRDCTLRGFVRVIKFLLSSLRNIALSSGSVDD